MVLSFIAKMMMVTISLASAMSTRETPGRWNIARSHGMLDAPLGRILNRPMLLCPFVVVPSGSVFCRLHVFMHSRQRCCPASFAYRVAAVGQIAAIPAVCLMTIFPIPGPMELVKRLGDFAGTANLANYNKFSHDVALRLGLHVVRAAKPVTRLLGPSYFTANAGRRLSSLD